MMNTTTMIPCRHISLYDTPAGNHGSFVHQNKYPIQDDEYNYSGTPL